MTRIIIAISLLYFLDMFTSLYQYIKCTTKAILLFFFFGGGGVYWGKEPIREGRSFPEILFFGGALIREWALSDH